MATFLCVTLSATLAGVANGPWLRVRGVSVEGAAWTSRSDVAEITDAAVGQSMLLVDGTALAEALGELPAIERAELALDPFGGLRVTLVEGGAVAIWRTTAAQLLVAEDGTVIGIRSVEATVPGSLADLPLVDDDRDASHDLTIGDAVAGHELQAALALAALPAGRLGSDATALQIALDATYGFVLSSPEAGWRAAFGFYGLDPTDTGEVLDVRIASQAGALRTLFRTHPEAGLAWIDVRNPGRVYFRARG